MATIKIDRGFTQKIQQKGLIHSPTQEPTPPKRQPKTERAPKWIPFALAGGAGLLGVIVLAVVLGRGGDQPKAPAAPAPRAAATAAPAPAAPDEIVDPDEAFYAQHSGKPSPQAAPPSTPSKTAAPPSKPVQREIPPGSTQGLLCDYYENLPGKPISALREAPAYPASPSRTVQVGAFELSENVGDNYGARVRGYLVPPASGTYRFALCGDDSAELWLSTDSTPANLRRLVTLNGWVVKYGWTNRTDQQSAPFELTGGQRYYLEAFVKENAGNDFLMAAWRGPVSEAYTLIEGRYLQPWSDTPAPVVAADAAAERQSAEAALAPARAAVEEQQRKNGAAYRYAEAAETLKGTKDAWQKPEALELIETAILRFETLGRLRAFVQAELARAPLRGVWTAFGGQLDVTGASDEGVMVAPGRIVAWAKVPPDQMLRLVNATVPKAAGDTTTKGVLLLASALFCKEVAGGLDLALKYRARAVAIHSALTPLADRLLGGSPESLLAQARIQAARPELTRLATSAAGLAEKVARHQAELAAFSGLVPGLNVEYWERLKPVSLNDARKQGLLNETPSAVVPVADFAVPENRTDTYIARVRGYLTPPESGEYLFYIAADDQGELWLSSDESPDNLALCVKVDTVVKRRVWDKDKRRSKPVALVKGKHYCVEAFMREGAGEDHLAVAWSPAASDAPELITSANLLCSATAGFTPRAQELRKLLDEELQRVQSLAAEVVSLRAADDAQAGLRAPATPGMADDLQKKIERAKETLGEAEGILKRVDATLPQFKAAIRPASAKS